MSAAAFTLAIVGASPTAADLRRQCAARDIDVLADGAPLVDVQLVIEAAADDDPRKAVDIARVAELAPGTPIAVLTAIYSITELAASLGQPELVCGLHLVPQLSPKSTGVAEIIAGLRTGTEVLELTTTLVERLDLGVLAIADRPGGLVHRLLIPYLNDVVQAFDDGLASARDVDVALELGLGYPRGPLAVIDTIGAAAVEGAGRDVHVKTGDSHFAPPPLLTAIARAGLNFHDDEKEVTS